MNWAAGCCAAEDLGVLESVKIVKKEAVVAKNEVEEKPGSLVFTSASIQYEPSVASLWIKGKTETILNER